jgi:hypothetical protein
MACLPMFGASTKIWSKRKIDVRTASCSADQTLVASVPPVDVPGSSGMANGQRIV